MRIQKTSEDERASIKFINRIPKGKKSQFDLLQYIRYSPLFKQQVDELGITENAIESATVNSLIKTVDNKNNEEEKHSSTKDSFINIETESVNLSEDIPDLASEDESEDETEDESENDDEASETEIIKDSIEEDQNHEVLNLIENETKDEKSEQNQENSNLK